MIAIVVAVVLAALLIIRDLSARRRERVLMAEIASLRKKVTHTDRIANVGRLVSGLAQDLKSPLQGMLGSAEVLAVSDPATGAGAQEVQDIRDNVTRAVGIVRNLLAFTETSVLNRRWHDLNDVVRRALDHKRQDGDADDIKLDETPRLPLVYVDGRQIEKSSSRFSIMQRGTAEAAQRARSRASHDAARWRTNALRSNSTIRRWPFRTTLPSGRENCMRAAAFSRHMADRSRSSGGGREAFASVLNCL